MLNQSNYANYKIRHTGRELSVPPVGPQKSASCVHLSVHCAIHKAMALKISWQPACSSCFYPFRLIHSSAQLSCIWYSLTDRAL